MKLGVGIINLIGVRRSWVAGSKSIQKNNNWSGVRNLGDILLLDIDIQIVNMCEGDRNGIVV